MLTRAHLRAAGLGLLAFCWAARAAAPAEFAVEPYVQNPGKTEMTVKWSCREKADFKLRCGTGEKLDREFAPGEPREVLWKDWPGGQRPADAAADAKPTEEFRAYIYQAVLTGLAPGTAYRYEVSSGAVRAGGTFRTFPEKPGPFTFIAYGDNRSDPEAHRRVTSGFAAQKPEFIIHTGDMVTNGTYPEWEKEFFAPLREVIRDVPLFPSLGNHDGDSRKFFAVPPGGKGLWYSFDRGDAHFVCLDSISGKPEMLEWCERDLAASRATWKIVFGHISAYDVGSHSTRWGRADYLPVFRKHGVDLVFSAHTHGYQRFRPVFTKGVNEARPITYIVTAGGGAPFHALTRDSALAVGKVEHHFLALTVDGNRLAARAISAAGKEIDAFEIVKKDGVPGAEWLKAAIPEDDFDAVRKVVRPYLRGIALPRDVRAGGAVKTEFKLGAGEKAAKYTVTIDPRAAANWELPEVSGAIPAGGTADVSLSVRLRDPAPYRDGQKPLPPLMIEVGVEIDGWRTGMLTSLREASPVAPGGAGGAQ
ncbi:MAG TPA: metallophosphoesterase family protein [Planctomycetota bacterium]|nr:metallophosphoesterase family protein [Planctomycetota bacterium]